MDAADLAEVVFGGMCTKGVGGECILSSQNFHLVFVDGDYEHVFSATNRAVTGSQFLNVGFYLKFDGAAMTRAVIGIHMDVIHFTSIT